jgi:hypothetical protein
MSYTIPKLQRSGTDELTGELALAGVSSVLELIVETDHPQPLPPQARALGEFMRSWSSLHSVVELALFTYYCGTALGATESGPAIVVAADVWRRVSLSRARALRASQAGWGIVQLTGNCSWEDEHGLELDFVGGTDLVYLGQHTGRGYLESNGDKPWNYASAKTQHTIRELWSA